MQALCRQVRGASAQLFCRVQTCEFRAARCNSRRLHFLRHKCFGCNACAKWLRLVFLPLCFSTSLAYQFGDFQSKSASCRCYDVARPDLTASVHLTGVRWFAAPSLCGSCIRYSMPVYPGLSWCPRNPTVHGGRVAKTAPAGRSARALGSAASNIIFRRSNAEARNSENAASEQSGPTNAPVNRRRVRADQLEIVIE